MLVCVTNRKLCREPFLKRIEKLAKSGIDWIILREKDLALEQYRELAKKVNEICSRYGTFLTVYSQEIDFPVHSIQMSYSDFMAVYSQKWNTGKGAKANLSIHNTQTGVSIHSTQLRLKNWEPPTWSPDIFLRQDAKPICRRAGQAF